MLIPFFKMQAQGNDFVILDLLDQNEPEFDAARLAQDICHRNFGVGADGLALLLSSETASARMVIYNSDGSRAEMCGSVLRCCSWYLYDKTGNTELALETDSGIKAASILVKEGKPEVVVNLGQPLLLEQELELEGLTGLLIGVGNRHFVSFWDDLASAPHLRYGSRIEHSPQPWAGLNSQYVKLLSRTELDLLIWENACGATLACGTGAVASVFGGILKGWLDEEVKVNMPGGSVLIQRLENGEFLLKGTVELIFSGEYRWKV